MGVASADYVGPINRLQEALQRRANWEMHWHRGPDPDDPRSRLVDIIGGRLLLSHFPHYTKLTVIYETTSKPQDGRRERGRRVAGAGSIARMYAIAHDLATYGIRGGPAFTDGPWVWERVDEDSWQRMLVPDGELRLSAPERPDGLVVASPPESHLQALQAALAAGVACLCEKPLVLPRQTDAAAAVVGRFRARGLLLDENCQWPFVLPALFELHPGLAGQRVDHVAMGLSPIGTGFSMIEDSLSHVLSLVQGLGVVGADTVVGDVRCSDPAPSAPRCVVSFSLASGPRTVAVTLHLESHPRQPRPAWFAVNNVRIDRRIGENYALSFVAADGRATNVTDPLHQLVYRLALQLQAEPSESTRAFASPLDDRLRLYAAILRAIEGR